MSKAYLTKQLVLLLALSLLGFVFGCHVVEREALTKFKHSFINQSRLSSWKGEDCCHWFGVRCDNVTGYVNHLDVHNPYEINPYDFHYDWEFRQAFPLTAKELEPSLAGLRQLRLLDLSGNDFQGSKIPRFIGSFKELRYLNLSGANFSGVVPPELGNLTSLQVLGMASLDLKFRADWATGLNNLKYLNLADVSIILPPTENFIQTLHGLTSLLDLRLSNCWLYNHNLFSPYSYTLTSVSNMSWISSIQHLEISILEQSETTLPPLFLANMSSLRYLDLSYSNFSGSIPLVGSNLRYLNLRGNNFTHVEGGTIMGLLGNLCKLQILDISSNFIDAEMVRASQNISTCETYDLKSLEMQGNKIRGTLPYWLGDYKRLKFLDTSYNQMSGQIPASIGSLTFLEKLHLANNYLHGAVPSTIGGASSLKLLDLSMNSLNVSISESHFLNLSKLESLDLSFNHVELNFTADWEPPFQLNELHMISCNIHSEFPRWIQTQAYLSVMDLSDNQMFGELPDLFSSLQLLQEINVSHNLFTGPFQYFSSSQLVTIDISYNSISGPIPDCWGYLEFMDIIDLSYNELSGNIPVSIGLNPNLVTLKLNNNELDGHIPFTIRNSSVITLDLGENKLSGEIPSFSENTNSLLSVLILRANQFTGVIPPQMCSLGYLHFLDLADNKLTGTIPRCLGHMAAMGSVTSSAGGFEALPPSNANTMVVLKGEELEYSTTLELVVNLDLSSNELTGSIPQELTNLTYLIGLNLSNNHLTGSIPVQIGKMGSLESLDLSNNGLTGTIPSSISTLNSLVRLNLSYNELHGQIPTGNQLQVLEDPSMIYIGNPGLCGDPLPYECKRENRQQQEEQDKDDNRDKVFLYLAIMLGVATGFWGVVGSLVVKKKLRYAWFKLIDDFVDYIYVVVVVRMNRSRK